jgi:hypothetical protein
LTTHAEHEDFPWTIAVVDPPPRADSPAYRVSKKLMSELVKTLEGDWFFPGPSYEDHHGGGLWLKDESGWLCLQLSLGIEWSAQFCADPTKVDRLRQQAARVVAAFPQTVPAYAELGYGGAGQLLATPIATAAQVAAWTDSIFNASLPLPKGVHSGALPTAAGYHHYPKPIVDIDHFRYDDFQLFVQDAQGHPAAVVPVSPRGSGDSRVRLLAVHPGSAYAERLIGHEPLQAAAATGEPALIDGEDPLAKQAFAHQIP